MSNGRVVLISMHVSVTCSLREEGAEWWLTRESGRAPRKCRRRGCERHSVEGTEVDFVEPKAVMVIQCGTVETVAIGLLCAEALDAVRRGIVPEMLRLAEDPTESVRGLFLLLSSGLFSSGVECECFASLVCSLCLTRSPRFLHVPVGTGVCFLSNSPYTWFYGVTDAVGVVRYGCRSGPWLEYCLWRRACPALGKPNRKLVV